MGIKHWCVSLIPQRFLFSYSGVLLGHQAFRIPLGDFNMQQSMGRRGGLIFTPNSTLCWSCCLFPFSSSLQTTSPLISHVTDDHLLELLYLLSPLSELHNEPREGSAYYYNPVLWFFQHNPWPDRDRLKSLSTYRKFNTDILNPCTHVKYDYSQNKHIWRLEKW